ncbi:unnamed protein product [Clonostachys byssicola]|uniref:ABC1 atypical kinase-like domain-containing protein n=1 Tax=Clonostachys byssicola TaxID=160290 RepID=A0A9N9UZ04_9HYPO|nr:unnamed protein product [Clonostachys byssicola]
MNTFTISASFATRSGVRSWTCSTCRSQLLQSKPIRLPNSRRRFTSGRGSSHEKSSGGRKSSQRFPLYASTGATVAGVTALAFTDEIKSGYESAERTGRVAIGLAVCINDYRRTLKKRETIEDPDERERILSACHQRCADRTLKVLEKNGGIFIKLGQHLSAMNYLLPTEWTTTFIPLQDKCPVSPFHLIQDMYQHDTGVGLWDYFSEFSTDPIGAASLAQVHLATIRETGRKVAVKVQHPELEAFVPLDVALTKYTFSTLKRFFPEYDLEWLSSEVEISLPKELDFQEEAKNAARMRAHFDAHAPQLPLVIPEVLWAKKRILVMACESGNRPDDLEYLDRNGIDRDEVSATMARIFNEMIFGDGAPLHCDPHGGNIAIRKNTSRRGLGRGPNFDIILYDHGLYRDIPLDLRRSYAKMWLSVIDGDMKSMRKYAHEVAGIEDKDFPLFASAITGRDYSVVSTEGSILKNRSSNEQKSMSSQLQEGLIVDLVQLLARVPRIILLILKTNDLTRSLDENLHTSQGPIRSFLILARFCTRTVFLEQVEKIREQGSLLWPPHAARLLVAWLGYMRVELKVEAFELWLGVKRLLGLRRMEFSGSPLATN